MGSSSKLIMTVVKTFTEEKREQSGGP